MQFLGYKILYRRVNMEENVGEIRGELQGIKKTQDKILQRLDGNGQPGLSERMTRTEDNIDKLESSIVELKDLIKEHIETSTIKKEEEREVVQELNQAITKFSAALEQLTQIVKDHVKDDSKHTIKGLVSNKGDILAILFSKNVLLYIVIIFMILNTFVPKSLNLGDVILKLIGVQ